MTHSYFGPLYAGDTFRVHEFDELVVADCAAEYEKTGDDFLLECSNAFRRFEAKDAVHYAYALMRGLSQLQDIDDEVREWFPQIAAKLRDLDEILRGPNADTGPLFVAEHGGEVWL